MKERGGFAQALITLVLLGGYVFGSLWLIESGNAFIQTLGVLALVVALLIVQTAVLTEAVKKHA